MLSYWEIKSFTAYDVAIVGAGITGLSTAIELKEKQPDLQIIVLEKGLLPTGASTKNAGFACVGSLTEILADLNTMTEQAVVDLVKWRKEGLDILRKRLGDRHIDYLENGSYELCFDDMNYSNAIERVNNLLWPIFNKPVFHMTPARFGFHNKVKTIISSAAEGQIDTGKMIKQLVLLAGKLGIEIKTGYGVEALEQTADGVNIKHSQLNISAKKVCVCANAFAQTLLPELEVKPGRGQVLITKPIENLPFKGIFHFQEGYYYFRTLGKRVLFGGGRQLDFKGETTFDFNLNQTIQADLENKLATIILPNIPFEIEHRWTGIMAFGSTKAPIVKQISQHLYAAVRFGGMGVAIGSKAAEQIADKMLSDGL